MLDAILPLEWVSYFCLTKANVLLYNKNKWYFALIEFNAFNWCYIMVILCDHVRQWLATSRWFSLGTPVFPTNKTDRHDKTEILLKVASNTTALTPIIVIHKQQYMERHAISLGNFNLKPNSLLLRINAVIA